MEGNEVGFVSKDSRSLGLRDKYDHGRLERRRRFLRWLVEKIAFRTLVKVERVEGLENLPEEGPAIIMMNHIAFVDPIVVLASLPRNIVPLAKVEAFRIPIFGIFPGLWKAIPVQRGAFDRRAVQLAMEVLNAGEIILVAPEGTRNDTLQKGKEGVAYLGHRSGAPVIATAVSGTEGFPTPNPFRWRKPGAVVKLGRPFRFRPQTQRPKGSEFRKMTDEAMYVLASMLSPDRRGVYSDLKLATHDTLEFV